MINENYLDFLSLGRSLHGGEEKVEEVRLGLLGFKRDVEGLNSEIAKRKDQVESLVIERKRIREEVQVGRALLEIDQRLQDLEEKLMIASNSTVGNGEQNEEEVEPSEYDEDSDEGELGGISISRLRRHMQQYVCINKLMARIGPEHPFLVKQEERVLRLKQTVFLDLSSALKQANATSEDNKERLMKILGIYRNMGEPGEALNVLREKKL